ncbi:MAG: ferritin family protein [Candidatus Tenebribacter burtonii]|jgi:rubrerythrin|nr:ferritin family protein [Candidatus Tenebribacter burtonii]
MKELTLKEIIEYAIKIEKESYSFYKKAENIVDDQNVKKLLILLANEEIDHQNRLLVLIDEEIVSAKELEKKRDVNISLMESIIATSNIVENCSSREVLKIALEREKNTEQSYSMLLTLSDISEEIVNIFDELRLQEKGHVQKIQNRINNLTSIK